MTQSVTVRVPVVGLTSLPFLIAPPYPSASVESSNNQDTPTATTIVGGNVVTVDLHGINNQRKLTVVLENASDGTNTNYVPISIGILAGDTTGDGHENSADIGQTKSRSGQLLDGTNFQSDVNIDGSINSADIGLVKAGSGTALP